MHILHTALYAFSMILTWEFVKQSRASKVGDHLLYSYDLYVWFKCDMVGRNWILITSSVTWGWRIKFLIISFSSVFVNSSVFPGLLWECFPLFWLRFSVLFVILQVMVTEELVYNHLSLIHVKSSLLQKVLSNKISGNFCCKGREVLLAESQMRD